MKNITCSHPSILVHKKRSLPCVAFSVFGAFFIVGSVFSFDASIVYAATYNFVQSGWSGGLDAGTVATHTLNQSNWGKYSTSTGLTMGSTVQIPLSSYTFTDDGATSTSPTATTFGGGFSNGINTSTIVSGSGVGASVQLPVTGPLTALTPPTVVTGTGPNTIFLSPDGTSAYVMNRSNDTISMFSRNTTTGVLTALATPTIAGGHHTAQGIISPDGNWVYLANAGLSGDYNIRLYSRNTGTGALTYISIQGGTNGSLTMSHDGKSIYTNTYQSTSVSELSRNITTGVLTSVGSTPVGTGSGPYLISPDDTSVYIANAASSTISMFSRNTTTGVLTALATPTVVTGTTPNAISISADGTSVYVTNSSSNTISMYSRNISTGALTALATPTVVTGTTPSAIIISTDNASVYVLNSNLGATVSMYSRNISTGALTALATPTIATGSAPSNMIISSDNTSVYVSNGTSNTVSMYSRGVGVSIGTFTSAPIDLGTGSIFGTLDMTATLNGQTITMRARSSATADFSAAPAWASCTVVTMGSAMSTGGCVTNGHRYIQWQATLSTTDTTVTPMVNSVLIGYSQYGSGNFVSSIYDAGDATNLVTGMRWTATGTTTTETVKFQLRSAPTAVGIATAPWCGPADVSVPCSGTSYFTDATGAAALSSTNPLRSGGDDQFFQYRAFFASSGSATPTLTQTTVQYVVNAAPDFDATYGTNGVTVSQNSATSTNPGAVAITYKVRDIDTATGSVNPGYVTPSFEYNIGSGWVAIPANALAASDVTNKFVDSNLYNTYSATWSASTTLSGVYAAGAQIRVTVNDNEAANNTAQAVSAAFALDTQAPVVTATINASVNGTITLSATDNSQLQYRICNDVAFPAVDGQSNSCAWSTLGGNASSTPITWTPLNDAQGNSPVYLQAKDAFGNTTNTQTIVAPAIPVSFNLKDISNPAVGTYKEFLSWGVFTATSSVSFGSYKLYTSSSTDTTAGTLLATITDPSINYYIDTITVATTSAHYYKAVITSTQGNTSAYTATLSDVPNGQGSTDITPPVIDPTSIVVPGATLKNTSALITFSTDELSRGALQYKVNGNSGWFNVTSASYSLAHSIYLQGLSPNTAYNLQVQATDVVGNASAYVSGPDFTTVGGPVITNVSEINLSDVSASIVWNTATSSDSYVYYSTNQDLSGATLKGNATQVACIGTVCAHKVDLPALIPATTYYFYVQSTDGVGNTTIDNNVGTYYNFHTTLDVAPPIVSNISTPVISSNAAVIIWQTDKPSSSQLQWGLASGQLTRSSVSDLTQTIQHIVSLSTTMNDTLGAPETLTPLTQYYFKVLSVGANGITSSSTEQTFTTSKVGDVIIVMVGGGGGGAAPAVTTPPADVTPPVIHTVTANNMGAFSADVKIETDKDVVAFVEYGKDTSYGSTEGSRVLSSSKLITINKLSEGTLYHYKVTVIDKSGNTTTSNDQTFKTIFISELLDNRSLLERASDIQGKIEQLIESSLPSLAPPFIATPIVSSTTEDSAVITWVTNIKTIGSARFATDADFATKNDYTTEISDGTEASTTHSVTLTGLLPNTLYHVRAQSFVFPQVVGKSPDITFSTKASAIVASIVAVKNNGFTVVWQTSDPTTSIVEYTDSKTGKSDRITDTAQTMYHSMEIQNLPAGTSYRVSVSGVNKNGNTVGSAKSLYTVTSVDVTPPVISNFKVDNALIPGRTDLIQTVVGWKTDKPSNSTVYYQEGTSAVTELKNKVEQLDVYTTAHIMILATLKPCTVYSIKVVSTDISGNTKVFGPTSIITPSQTKSVLDIIVKNFEETFKFLGAGQ